MSSSAYDVCLSRPCFSERGLSRPRVWSVGVVLLRVQEVPELVSERLAQG